MRWVQSLGCRRIVAHLLPFLPYDRLRDMSNDTEKLQKARIAELEKETSGSEDLHRSYRFPPIPSARLIPLVLIVALQSTQAELQAAELQLDDLKQQLEVALGADEMLEMLTERTLTMGEVRSGLRERTASVD